MDHGKEFESITKNALLAEGCCFDRLPDQMTGRAGSVNPGDFTAYLKPHYLYIECKSCSSDLFTIKNYISEKQWLKLLKKARPKYPGVYVGYLVWLIADSRIFWIPALKMEALYKEHKSFDAKIVAPWAVPVKFEMSRGKPVLKNLIKTIVTGEKKLK